MRAFFFLLIIGPLITLSSGCQSTQSHAFVEAPHDPILQNKQPLSNFEHNINLVLNSIAQGELVSAQQQYNAIEKQAETNDEIILLAYTQVKLFLAQKNLDNAYAVLISANTEKHITQSNIQTQINIGLLKCDVLTMKSLYLEAAKQRAYLATLITDENLYQQNHKAIWNTLNTLSIPDIESALKKPANETLRLWLDLNLLFRNNKLPLDDKIKSINEWYINNPTHPATLLHVEELASLKEQPAKPGEKIAILLPFSGKYSSIAEAIRDGFMQSYFSAQSQSQISFYNTAENEPFLSIYNKAVKDGATLIIGPLFKNQLEELRTVNVLPVKTIALNKLTPSKTIANLFQFSLAPEDEIFSIIQQCSESKLKNVFILSQKDEFSQKNMATFIEEWKQLNNNVIAQHSFSETTDLAIELETPLNIIASKTRTENLQNLLGLTLEQNPKSRSDIDMVMLFVNSENAQDINPLLNSYLPNDAVKYATSGIYRGFNNTDADQELNGIIATDIPLIIFHPSDITNKYRGSPLIRMYAFGIDAFQLSDQLPSMINNSNYTFQGATGNISLVNGIFSRKTVFGIFSNGALNPLTNTNYQ